MQGFIYNGFLKLGYQICQIEGENDYFFKQIEIVFLERSHAVLSMIFGIFGKFGIEIGDPKNFGRFCQSKKIKKSVEKKSRRKKN